MKSFRVMLRDEIRKMRAGKNPGNSACDPAKQRCETTEDDHCIICPLHAPILEAVIDKRKIRRYKGKIYVDCCELHEIVQEKFNGHEHVEARLQELLLNLEAQEL